MNDNVFLGAAALTGFAVFEVQRSYCAMAPDMKALRNRDSKSTEAKQMLMDADMCTGGLALLAGITASWLSKSVIPIVVIGCAFAWIAYYHHEVLNGLTPSQIDGR